MKKGLALILALVMCLSLCACGSKKVSEDDIREEVRISEDDIREEVRITVRARAIAKCMFTYQNVKFVSTAVTTMDDNGDGTYDVKGYITVIDDYGDSYKAKFDATVSVDEEGEGTCKSFDMDTPKKE